MAMMTISFACGGGDGGFGSYYFFSPGVKLCYEFGEHNGFSAGIEVSAGHSFGEFGLTGLVLGTQWNFQQEGLLSYAEWEVLNPFFGGAIGMQTGEDRDIAFRVRFFAGLLGYLSAKFTTDDTDFELGLVGKYPVYPHR